MVLRIFLTVALLSFSGLSIWANGTSRLDAFEAENAADTGIDTGIDTGSGGSDSLTAYPIQHPTTDGDNEAADPAAISAVGDTTVSVCATIPDTTAITICDAAASDSSAMAAKTAEGGAKPGFVKRVVNYFAGSNEDKTLTRKFDVTIIPGPNYASDTKLAIGVVASGLFRADRKDLTIPPSNVSIFGNISVTGFYNVGLKGNTLFNSEKFRIDYDFAFISMPGYMWGIGYDAGLNDEGKSEYKRLNLQLEVDFMWRVLKNIYIGANVNFYHIKGVDFEKPPSNFIGDQETQYTNIGTGPFIIYDSRDIITNPSRGWFLKVSHKFYPGFLGNKPSFSRTEGILNFYHRIWKGGIMAYDLHGRFNNGDVPWTMLSRIGNSYRMRGYYEGRFQDRHLLEFQAELRQRIWRRIGVAAWGGVGNVFDSMRNFTFSQSLPNYGFGLRWELKKNVNVRLDYGFGKKQSGFLFQINEAF